MFRKLYSTLYHATQNFFAKKSNVCPRPQTVGLNGVLGSLKEYAGPHSPFPRHNFPVLTGCNKKLTIVGPTIAVLDIAYSCLNHQLCNQICIMDCFSTPCKQSLSNLRFIMVTNKIADTRNSDLIMVSRDIIPHKYFSPSSMQNTANLCCTLVPELLKFSPNSLLYMDMDDTKVINEITKKLSISSYTKQILHRNHKLVQELMCLDLFNTDALEPTDVILIILRNLKSSALLQLPKCSDNHYLNQESIAKYYSALYHGNSNQIAAKSNLLPPQQAVGLNVILDNIKNSAGPESILTRHHFPILSGSNRKLTIVGVADSVLNIASNCVNHKLCNQIFIMDCFSPPGKQLPAAVSCIVVTNKIADTRNSDLVMVTREIIPKKYLGSTSIQNVANVCYTLVPELLKFSPKSLLYMDLEDSEELDVISKKLPISHTNRILHRNHKLLRDFISWELVNLDAFEPTHAAFAILKHYNFIKGLTVLEMSKHWGNACMRQGKKYKNCYPSQLNKVNNMQHKFKKIII